MYKAKELLIVRKTEWTISLFQGLLVNVLFIPLFVFQTFDLFVVCVFREFDKNNTEILLWDLWTS